MQLFSQNQYFELIILYVKPKFNSKHYSFQGDLFGKMDPEDSFSFSLPSCSSGQTFQDGKDNFSFPFAFGASQPASLKGFQSAAESRKTFSLF